MKCIPVRLEERVADLIDVMAEHQNKPRIDVIRDIINEHIGRVAKEATERALAAIGTKRETTAENETRK